MKEKRSLFNMIFKNNNKPQKEVNNILKLLGGYNATFSPISENIEENIVARQCINAIATHCAKMLPIHYIYKSDRYKERFNGDISYIVGTKPNPYMTTYDFLYKTTSILLSQNNVFIYQDINNGKLEGLYVLNPRFCELHESEGKIYVKFQFVDGNKYFVEYESLIHLRNFYINHDIFGDGSKVLKSAIETQTIADDGIKNAIKISSNLRGVLKATQSMLKDKDLKKMKDDFINDLVDSTDGIAGLDARLDFKEINMNPILLNKEQLEAVNGNIYKYFMISEKILTSDFKADEWDAFYESVIEPKAIQFSQAFTKAIFSDKAIRDGNVIEFSVNRIRYAKTETKISLIKELGVLGILKVDEAREVLDLPAIGGEEGQKRLQTLNVINANIADSYQGGVDSGE